MNAPRRSLPRPSLDARSHKPQAKPSDAPPADELLVAVAIIALVGGLTVGFLSGLLVGMVV